MGGGWGGFFLCLGFLGGGGREGEWFSCFVLMLGLDLCTVMPGIKIQVLCVFAFGSFE